MPRHFPDNSTIQDNFRHSDYPAVMSDKVIPGSTPGAHVQRRGRGDPYVDMTNKSMLKNGFGDFLSEVDSSQRLGDAARRHYVVPTGVEQQWRSSVHAVPEFQRDAKPYGKRFGHAPPTGSGQESTEIPRGMKHVQAPQGKLAEEMDLFKITKARVFNQDGYSKANLQSIPSDTSHFAEHNQRRHGGEGARNGVPQRTPGDKLTATAEYDPQFYRQNQDRFGNELVRASPAGSARSVGASGRLAVGGSTALGSGPSISFEKREAGLAVQKDRSDVANLPKYPKAVAEAPTGAAASSVAPIPAAPAKGKH